MGRKAQALLELALFVSIMLVVLLTALNYQRNMREQKQADENVFEQTKKASYGWEFSYRDVTDENDKNITGSGAIVSYSLNVDRQANRLFQGGQRRTVASSATVYNSNSEDPPNIEYNYYDNVDIGPEAYGNAALKKKIYVARPGGTEDPEDGLKLKTFDYIAILYPGLSSLVTSIFGLSEATWYIKWGGWVDLALRTASFAYLSIRYNSALNDLEDTEDERAALKVKDDEMGEWGWRICDLNNDGQARAGKFYVKDVTAQVYDIETDEDKSIQYDETQEADKSTRTVDVGHVVKRNILRRFDTSMNPTLPLAQHTFDYNIPPKEVTLDLSGGQNETWN
jgi:hypothetical protein